MNCLISFIVPAYNCADSIEFCLESIISNFALPYKYEIIVVDDASTDNTYEIVQHYISGHEQCRLIRHNVNKRQGGARNTGIKESMGDLITFVDADDMILSGVNNAIRNALKFQANITFCYRITGNEITCCGLKDGEIIDGISFMKNEWNTGCFWRPWGYIFKKSFLLDKPFVENRRHEDRDWIAKVLSECDTIVSSSIPMYLYKRNANSTCNARDYDLAFDHIACGIRFIKLANSLKEKELFLHQALTETGVDEIYKNIRIRNLSKYQPSHNCHYLSNLFPLENDLLFLSRINNNLYSKIRFYIFYPRLYQNLLILSFPIVSCGRKMLAFYRRLNQSTQKLFRINKNNVNGQIL